MEGGRRMALHHFLLFYLIVNDLHADVRAMQPHVTHLNDLVSGRLSLCLRSSTGAGGLWEQGESASC